MSKTGGNMEPMPFVRKWGAAAQPDDGDDGDDSMVSHSSIAAAQAAAQAAAASISQKLAARSADVDQEYAGPAPPPELESGGSSSSKRRDRSRSRSRDRKKDKKKRSRSRSRDRKKRSRSKDRERDREKRRSSRDRERRRRSHSREREIKTEPQVGPQISVARPIINPLVRPEFAAQVAAESMASIPGMPPPAIAEVKAPDGTVAVVTPDTAGRRDRKSRWSSTKSFVPGMPTILPKDLTEDQRTAYLLQLEIEDCTRKLRTGEFGGSVDGQRSPSPEPIYDANGKRLNTREVRKKQEVEQIRHEKIQALIRINPMYKPPTDYRAPNIKMHDKVWIPQEHHPELNFVGLLIGPRGKTLKALEAETGAKIIIRGKGSMKEGKLASRVGPMPGENEPLHAYVTGPTRDIISKACEKIKEIIAQATCGGPQQNDLRALQLRELAMMNGTLRPEDLLSGSHCSNCGSQEHKTWDCPDAPNVTAGIVCQRCGGAGHLTKDCRAELGDAMNMAAMMDDEYSALMQELGEKPMNKPSLGGGPPAPTPGAGGYGAPAAAARGRGRGRGAFGNTETPGFMGQKTTGYLPDYYTASDNAPMSYQPPPPPRNVLATPIAPEFLAARAAAYASSRGQFPSGGNGVSSASADYGSDAYSGGFFSSPGARGRGRGASPWSAGSSMPAPVPPPQSSSFSSISAFAPPPPPPASDLSRIPAIHKCCMQKNQNEFPVAEFIIIEEKIRYSAKTFQPTAGRSEYGRVKVALPKGKGLMDWVRLTSGKILAKKTLPAVDEEELAKHCVREDCWIHLFGNVYDVTAYLDFHPGGVDELMRASGRDATALFNQYHPWVNYDNFLKSCYVGKFCGDLSKLKSPDPPTALQQSTSTQGLATVTNFPPKALNVSISHPLENVLCIKSSNWKKLTPVNVSISSESTSFRILVRHFNLPVTELLWDDEFEISDSIGDKDFVRFAKDTKKCLFLAAGTGLTPMVGLLAARLRGRKLQVSATRLLMFNKRQEDIVSDDWMPFKWDDTRLEIMQVLSEEPSSEWQGLRGRINAEMFPVGVQDYFVFVCGPDGFVLSATK
ncbi:hypothetical protein WR25_22126 [Diploscapter pachys]|uniref:Branchpoint-bridging protein n=1 Tax=Diploscapter pachys TaxID=2018661 RepID=A0A2A2M0P1_9BILA|nr:hypothetical protein WR25_22126 [Diploscapter pachys]